MKTFEEYMIESLYPYEDNPFEKLSGRTLIFFDTETTGLNSIKDQVTEIAALAVDGETLEIKDRYHEYIKLYKINPDPRILQMTRYDASKATKDEQTVLKEFVDFVQRQPNPILVAHNATFDMGMIMDKSKRVLEGIKVYDTLEFARMLFAPTLVALVSHGNEPALKMLNAITKKNKEGKLIITRNNNRIIKATLHTLSDAVNDSFNDWHSAYADTMTLVQIFKKMREYYNKDILQDPAFRKAYTHAQKIERLMAHKPV